MHFGQEFGPDENLFFFPYSTMHVVLCTYTCHLITLIVAIFLPKASLLKQASSPMYWQHEITVIWVV